MKIKIIQECGPGYVVGMTYNVGEDSARILIASGHAQAVQAVETAALPPSPPREMTNADQVGSSQKRGTQSRAGGGKRAKKPPKDRTD